MDAFSLYVKQTVVDESLAHDLVHRPLRSPFTAEEHKQALASMDTFMLVALSSLPRRLSVIAEGELEARFRGTFDSLFGDGLRMRDGLREHGAVIFGSVAVDFFLGQGATSNVPAPRHVDVIVAECKHAPMCAFIVTTFGGKVVIPPVVHNLMAPSPTDHVGVSVRVDIVTPTVFFHVYASMSLTPLWPVVTSPALHLYTFLSADAACCAYPTVLAAKEFRKRELTHPDVLAVFEQKYTSRGFHVADNADGIDDAETSALSRTEARYFGDGHCIVVRFSPRRAHMPVSRDSLTVGWIRGGSLDGNQSSGVGAGFVVEGIQVRPTDKLF